MNIKGANTEAYYRFLRTHEDLGSNIKLAYGALHAISQDEEPIISDRNRKLIFLPTGGEPWGKNTRWRSVKTRIPNVRKLISEMRLVLAASAFEDFLTNVQSDHTRFSDFNRKEKSPEPASEEGSEGRERLRLLFHSIQWDISPIEYLLPLYDYFVIARNCVVHRSGRASPALVEKAESSALRDCMEKWPSRAGKAIPQLPEVQVGRDIPLLPRHVILFSEVCQRVALYTLTIRDYLRHSNLSVTNKYLQAASGSKRKAQEKLVDAILPAQFGRGGAQLKGRTLVAPEKSNVQAVSP
jgi:hypothetical protein